MATSIKTKSHLEEGTLKLEEQAEQTTIIHEEEIQKHIKEKEYLSCAVDAKDLEISHLKNKISSLQEQLNSIENKYRGQLQNYEQEISSLKEAAANNNQSEIIENLERRIKELEVIEVRRVNEVNNFMFAHGSLIKNIQGLIENATMLNDRLAAEALKE